jgi:hypothetical protein
MPTELHNIVVNRNMKTEDKKAAIMKSSADSMQKEQALMALRVDSEYQTYYNELEGIQKEGVGVANQLRDAQNQLAPVEQELHNATIEQGSALEAHDQTRLDAAGVRIKKANVVVDEMRDRVNGLQGKYDDAKSRFDKKKDQLQASYAKMNYNSTQYLQDQMKLLRADVKGANVLTGIETIKGDINQFDIKVKELENQYDTTRLGLYVQTKMQRLLGSPALCTAVQQGCKVQPDLKDIFNRPEPKVPPTAAAPTNINRAVPGGTGTSAGNRAVSNSHGN